jgi:hypothetical protein
MGKGIGVALACACACSASDDRGSGAALAFERTAPGEVSAPRGGLVDFAVRSVDADNPFGSAPPFVASGAIAIRFTEIAPARLTGTALVDPLAPLGPLRLELLARNARGELVSYASASDDPLAPVVTPARDSRRLTPGVAEPNEAIAAPRQSNLYAAAVPNDDQVFVLTFANVGSALRTISGTRLVGAAAPTSGKFAHGHLFETTFEGALGSRVAAGLLRRGKDAGDAWFAIHASDLSGGATNYTYSVKLALAKPMLFSAREPEVPDTAQSPLAVLELDGPAYAMDGAIERADDVDFVIFTPKKDGRVFVTATPIGASSPLEIAIFGNDPGVANCTAILPGGLGTTQAEVKATAGTPYCARVSSQGRVVTGYHLVVTPEL